MKRYEENAVCEQQ